MIQSFDEFIKPHLDRIYRICFSYLYDKSTADDVFQEVLYQIWKSMKQFKGDSKIETWIYRIAVNRTITFNRVKKPQIADIDAFEIVDQKTDPDNETIDNLHIAIGKLNSNDRLLTNLMLDGFSYQEISDIIGIEVNHVGVKLNRIRKKLENLLKEIV